MRVFLPLTYEEALAADLPTALPVAGGTELILVAEDEPSVGSLVVRVLRERGYRVLLARDGRDALSLWKRHRGEIDLLVTDVVMPHMGGPELVRMLHEMGDHPRVLFASGYTDDSVASVRELGVEVDLLEKPFSAAELGHRVRQALDRSPE